MRAVEIRCSLVIAVFLVLPHIELGAQETGTQQQEAVFEIAPPPRQEPVIIEATYTGEWLFTLGGGDATGRGDGGLVDVGITGRITDAAEITMILQGRRGGVLISDLVGVVQDISNIESDNYAQVSEFWWLQRAANGAVTFKIGKQDLNADFCVLDNGGDFIHSSFGIIPTVPMPTFPDPALGVTMAWQPTERLVLRAGVADGEPNGGTTGFDTMFDGQGGLFSVVETGVRVDLGDGLEGAYRIGAWHHGGQWVELTNDVTPLTFDGAAGWYLTADQSVYSADANARHVESANLVLQVGRSPEDRLEISRYVGAGVTINGLGRADSAFGIGIARAGVGAPEGGHRWETAIESFYRFWPTPWLALQPDVQYIINPGADGSDDALVVGLRFGVAL